MVALVATPALMLNWTTGEVTLTNNLFVLFGAAVTGPRPAVPWSLTFALPIGVVVAYRRFRAWRSGRLAPAPAARPGSPAEEDSLGCASSIASRRVGGSRSRAIRRQQGGSP